MYTCILYMLLCTIWCQQTYKHVYILLYMYNVHMYMYMYMNIMPPTSFPLVPRLLFFLPSLLFPVPLLYSLPSLPPSPSPDTKSTQWEDPRLIKKKQAAAAVVPYSRDYKTKYENFRKQLAQRKPVSCSCCVSYMYIHERLIIGHSVVHCGCVSCCEQMHMYQLPSLSLYFFYNSCTV